MAFLLRPPGNFKGQAPSLPPPPAAGTPPPHSLLSLASSIQSCQFQYGRLSGWCGQEYNICPKCGRLLVYFGLLSSLGQKKRPASSVSGSVRGWWPHWLPQPPPSAPERVANDSARLQEPLGSSWGCDPESLPWCTGMGCPLCPSWTGLKVSTRRHDKAWMRNLIRWRSSDCDAFKINLSCITVTYVQVLDSFYVSFSLMYISTKEIIEQSPWQLILVYV